MSAITKNHKNITKMTDNMKANQMMATKGPLYLN